MRQVLRQTGTWRWMRLMLSLVVTMVAAPALSADELYDVWMQSYGANEIKVVPVVKAFTGLGLVESKALTESAPCYVLRNVELDVAEDCVNQLTEAGATAEVRHAGSDGTEDDDTNLFPAEYDGLTRLTLLGIQPDISRLKVVAAVREALGVSLSEASAFTQNMPCVLIESGENADVRAAAEKIEAAGGIVQVKLLQVRVSDKNFPDEAFRSYICEHFDSEHDLLLTPDEMKSVSKIDVIGTVVNLQGLAFFPLLTELRCTKQSELDVTPLTKLETLVCNNGSLTEIDLSNCPQLKTLDLRYNQLSELDLLGNKELEVLYVSDNRLTKLPLRNHMKLYELMCDHNQLTELTFYASQAIRYVECHANQISGEAMDDLIESLPIIRGEERYCKLRAVLGGETGNVISHEQAVDAYDKGWQVQFYSGSEWRNFSYIEPNADLSATLDYEQEYADGVQQSGRWAVDLDKLNLTIHALLALDFLEAKNYANRATYYIDGSYRFDMQTATYTDKQVITYTLATTTDSSHDITVLLDDVDRDKLHEALKDDPLYDYEAGEAYTWQAINLAFHRKPLKYSFTARDGQVIPFDTTDESLELSENMEYVLFGLQGLGLISIDQTNADEVCIKTPEGRLLATMTVVPDDHATIQLEEGVNSTCNIRHTLSLEDQEKLVPMLGNKAYDVGTLQLNFVGGPTRDIEFSVWDGMEISESLNDEVGSIEPYFAAIMGLALTGETIMAKTSENSGMILSKDNKPLFNVTVDMKTEIATFSLLADVGPDDNIYHEFTDAERKMLLSIDPPEGFEDLIPEWRSVSLKFVEAPDNFATGDINKDGTIDIADAVSVLNIMAGDGYNADADINGDGTVDIADFVSILNIMAGE